LDFKGKFGLYHGTIHWKIFWYKDFRDRNASKSVKKRYLYSNNWGESLEDILLEGNSKKLGLKVFQESNENWLYSIQITVNINTGPLEFL